MQERQRNCTAWSSIGANGWRDQKGETNWEAQGAGCGVRRDCDTAGRGHASETRGMCQRKEVPAQLLRGHPSWPAGPSPTWWRSQPAPLPPTAHQLLTKDNNLPVAFQTQTWDLYFSLKINILKAVFFSHSAGTSCFYYLRKAFLAQANLFTVCLVKLAYKPAFRDLLYDIIKKAIFEKN